MKTPATVIAACPTYPGLAGAVGRGRLVALPDVGTAGVARAARAAAAPVIYVPSTGANPTGAVLPAGRRSELLEVARATAAVVVEDLALADLLLSGDDVPAPLAASHSNGDVIAVGSLSKLFWAGLRVGWVRASADTLDALTEMKVAMGLATSVPAQTIARDLLDAATDSWIGDLRSALRARRDRLRDHLEQRLPAWELPVGPDAGLSLWVRLPVQDAATFCATAARHGVVVAAGATMCACGRHHSYIRLSFAEPLAALDLGAERLATAWEAHAADLAATPSLKPASAVRRRAAC
jgi:DNA-binding transcriptional MocR family regulator